MGTQVIDRESEWCGHTVESGDSIVSDVDRNFCNYDWWIALSLPNIICFAAEHFPALPVEAIDWTVSHRAQRTAGATKYDSATDEITISLT